MQRTWATVMFALTMIIVSVSIQTEAYEQRSDLARTPSSALEHQSENELIPKPIPCMSDVTKVPDCIKAVMHFRFIEVTKECCTTVLNFPEDCFGVEFPSKFIYRFLLRVFCKIVGHI
ncbi:uncharacterized protein LOC108808507 [Raphanus sativus]|uniref:Uncharacterized protein LOC108808507 n=1 Tax=Raphanus sativus TaxID=3726 RepID=A0A6J0JKG1_RAPSA|nr:uncharacterized protein LOC108808507 [Raphanus sativus]